LFYALQKKWKNEHGTGHPSQRMIGAPKLLRIIGLVREFKAPEKLKASS